MHLLGRPRHIRGHKFIFFLALFLLKWPRHKNDKMLMPYKLGMISSVYPYRPHVTPLSSSTTLFPNTSFPPCLCMIFTCRRVVLSHMWLASTRLPSNAHCHYRSKYELLPNLIQFYFRLTVLKGYSASIMFFLLSLSSFLENWLRIELHDVLLLLMISSIILGPCLPLTVFPLSYSCFFSGVVRC
jgi:hypothetical protein